MTLADAFDIYTRNLHLRTIRRFMGWRVCNAANSNPRAASSLSLSRGQPQGAGVTPDARPRICQMNTHNSNSREF